MSPPALLAFSLLCWTAACAYTDARTGLIPNALTLPCLALAPPVHAISSGPGALGASLLGALLCGALPLWLFSRGGMGGGDVKLFAALGAAAGAAAGLRMQLFACLFAGAYACVRLAWEALVARPSTVGADVAIAARRELRLGVPIFLATLWTTLAPPPWPP